MSLINRTLPVLVVALLAFGASSMARDVGTKVVDRGKVYHGLADAFAAPAVIEASRVLETIPAMKEIETEGVKKSSARWFVLVAKANQQMQKAIRAVCQEKGYDLVAEVGAISSTATIPDVTEMVIKAAVNLPK